MNRKEFRFHPAAHDSGGEDQPFAYAVPNASAIYVGGTVFFLRDLPAETVANLANTINRELAARRGYDKAVAAMTGKNVDVKG